MKTPNLFVFAPKELSQDAFILWLAAWADPKYKTHNKALHQLGQQFVVSLIVKCKGSYNIGKIESVTVQKQYLNIDVLIIVNNKYFIIVEDKVSSNEHGGQLKRYLNSLQSDERYLNAHSAEILAIYYKTIEQSDLRNIKDAGYVLYSRKDFLKVFKRGIRSNIKNAILLDYCAYLNLIDNSINSDPLTTNDKSDGHVKKICKQASPWIGYYEKLKRFKECRNGDYGYVNNRRGGFWAFWFSGKTINDVHSYLQLEESKLCFRLNVEQTRLPVKNIAKDWFTAISEAACELNYGGMRPSRLQPGSTMAVYVADDYIVENDIKATLSRIKSSIQVLEYARKKILAL